ncbi:hypothetical protein Q5752_001764 [Cryptotrichosporon argae]
MAMPRIARGRSPSDRDTYDPVLDKLVTDATFDCDWPELRDRLRSALLAAPSLFRSLGPPQPRTLPPANFSSPLPPSLAPDSVPASPSRSIAPLPGADVDPALRPSTPGGLVIAPFPPLDPNRRRRSINGVQGRPGFGVHPVDEGYDEEIVIGGRKMPGWMEEEEARRETEKVAERIDELAYPPFTLQRLAELVLTPTLTHSSLGKFLRAVDKLLGVTTAFQPPSYVPVPVDAGAASTARDDDSTVPPGASTPMFSPVPFLTIRPEPTDGDEDGDGDSLLPDVSDRDDGDGLMSPLMLENSNGFFGGTSAGRSPTPEPEEDVEMPAAASSSASSRVATSPPPALPTHNDDPAHQPYLGRVDELDTGPLTSPPSNGHAAQDDIATTGTIGAGEGGAMPAHGMSERPVPISSTTVVDDSREIAPLPRLVSAQPKTPERGEGSS